MASSEHAFIEQGDAFSRIEAPALRRAAQRGPDAAPVPGAGASSEHTVVVIGAGQAGLSVGYHLARRGIDFVILDAGDRIGDSWRRRWDSLRLFTPARYDGLDGMRLPGPSHRFPTKDEMADYLEAYATRFALPVRNRMRVDAVTREADRYQVSAGGERYLADHVVVAAASYQKPRMPECARALGPAIRQLHASDYRRPGDLRPGSVLVVGAGNSGAEIALDLARTHDVALAGRHPGHLPFAHDDPIALRLAVPLIFRLVFHRLLSVDLPMGRAFRPKFLAHGGPLIRVKPADLARAGVRREPRLASVEGGLPVLADGRRLAPDNIVWCTGFQPGLDWLQLPVFDDAGRPRQYRGVAEGEPGLYFAGLAFQHSPSSTMIHGVGRDARRVAKRIAERVRRQVR